MADFKLVLNGGLGNQLFGWAAALGISQNTGMSFELNASSNLTRGFQLSEYGIAASFVPLDNDNFLSMARNRVSRRIRRSMGKRAKFRYEEQGFEFDSRFFENPKGRILRGYFQSPRYFEHVKGEVLSTLRNFKSSDSLYLELLHELKSNHFITVHIRRGDYIGLEHFHGIVDSNYFRRARDLALEENPNYRFVVFSDSIELAKADFSFGDLYIGEDMPLTPPQLLSLMSSTSGIIGSNSSLSWWSSYLLGYDNPFRVLPEPWFSTKDLDTQDLVPPEWRRLPSGY
jgi:hypothetical protein